ncbi:hypothetical protein WS62_31650 [Burkholderia sp. ABCPW 14]|uniref:Uncharacterized protein n=1 Tax=Burkholderia mayonis TaxID=1385591 RepID=A0A1B4FXM6_9BURK|nr:hypothetical protein WS71_13375 [Burkholderia mayonis]KVD76769.1 hypothetical protein WS62_31650 [Burkholderia sp. ABCPW 14]KVE52878.1 hypothetical protein WS71_08860 [Burkholderia mayonis]
MSSDTFDCCIVTYPNTASDSRLTQTHVQIDSYGGCVNANDARANSTSVYERRSLLKSQYQPAG